MNSSRPILRYHGGKFRLAAWIIAHFPPHRAYVEAFGGAASVLMRKSRAYAEVYNDLDSEVVNIFRILRDPVSARELERRLRLTPYAREEFAATSAKDMAGQGDEIERARRLIFRSFAGFGSAAANPEHSTGFRASSNRSGTTPAEDWANYPDALQFFVKRLAGVTIENRPAIEVIRAHDSADTLHYVDPPYVHATRRVISGNHFYRHEMADCDHGELAKFLKTLRGFIVVSGYPSSLYARLFADWPCRRRAAFADGAQPRTECLWLSPKTAAALDSRLPLEDCA